MARSLFLPTLLFFLMGSLQSNSLATQEPVFDLKGTITVTVPSDYDSTASLEKFFEKFKDNEAIIDKINDQIVENKAYQVSVETLEPGKTYNVSLFVCYEQATAKQCRDFLKKQGGILAGAPGASLLINEDIQDIPEQTWMLSFGLDDKNRIPMVIGGKGLRWKFSLAIPQGLPKPTGLLVFKKA